MELENLPYGIVILSIICVALVLGIVMIYELEISNPSAVDSTSDTFLGDNGTTATLTGEAITSFSPTRYNTSWINCDGTNDVISSEVTQTKGTVSFWFKNDTTDWTSIVVAGSDVYVNASIDATWAFFPYYIDGNDVYICKSDALTFFEGSIDDFRIYDTSLNSTEVTTIYNDRV